MNDDTDTGEDLDIGGAVGFLLADLHARMVADGLIPSREDPAPEPAGQEQSEP